MGRGATDVDARTSADRGAPADGPRERSEPKRVVVFAFAVLTIPLAAGTLLLVAGAKAPAPGPVLLLALVAMLAINHSVFFASEQAATAEVAVVLVAVTGFAGTAPWLGPLAVALLVGPLDVAHWERRSFVRMAYNSGNRGVAALAAAAAFWGASAVVDAGVAAVAAAVVFVATDLSVSSALLVAQGNPARLAVRRVADVDRLALPLAALGAAAGFLVDGFGWWLAALVVAPSAFAPELVMVVRARPAWRGRTARVSAVLAIGVAVSGALWLLAPTGSLATTAALLTVAVLLGAELDVDAEGRPSPLLVIVVVAAAIVVPGDGAYVVAPLAAVVASATTWWFATFRPSTCRAFATSIVAVAISVGTVAAASSEPAPVGSVVAVLLAATALLVLAVVGFGHRRAPVDAFGWSAPFLGVAAAIAAVWRVVGPTGAVLFVSWLGATAVVARSFGSVPWRGRLSARAPRAALGTRHRVGLVVVATTVLLFATLSSISTAPEVRATAAWLAVATLESMAAIDLIGVRQWRIAPRARTRTAALVAASAIGGVGAGSALADGHAAWSVALGLCSLTLVAAGWRPARCADAIRPPARTGRRR